jgi:carboxylesterase
MKIPNFLRRRAPWPRRLARLARLLLVAVPALALLAGAYACAGARSLKREIATTPRDPQTGIVRGTEAATLDPPGQADAPTTACLLIHGFIGSRKDFADLGERLAAAGFHVRLLRLPGHGTTPPDFAAQSPESLLRGAAAELQALRRQYRAVYVVGFSMGGALATLLAARQPVDRLVLASPYFAVTYKWYYLLPPRAWNAALSPVIPYLIKTDAFIKLNQREALKNLYTYRCVPTCGVSTLMALGDQAGAPATLQAIHCPALLVMAEGDDAASPAAARRAFAALGSPVKQSRWLSARNNHHIFWDYDCEIAKTAIVEFLKK